MARPVWPCARDRAHRDASSTLASQLFACKAKLYYHVVHCCIANVVAHAATRDRCAMVNETVGWFVSVGAKQCTVLTEFGAMC